MYFSKPNILKKPTFENGRYATGQLNSESYLLYHLLSPQKAQKSFQEAPRKIQKISEQKSLQYFRCYFGKWMSS